jgi:hypothetical protein
LPSGERTGVHAAIAGKRGLALALDYDDYLFGARTGPTAVLASLAVAEKVGASGNELLLAQVAVNEVGGRLGLVDVARGARARARGIRAPAGGAVIGAVTAEARRGADRARPLPGAGAGGDVIAVGGVRVRGAHPDRGAHRAGRPAGGGVRRQRPSAGVGSARRGRWSLRRLDRPPLLGAFGGLGTHWADREPGYKIYPGRSTWRRSYDCVLGLVRQHHIDPRKVYAIHVGAARTRGDGRALGAVHTQRRFVAGDVDTDGRVPVAAALIERELSPRQFGRDRIANAAIWELAAKVRLSLEDIARRARDRSPLRSRRRRRSSANLFDLTTCDLNAYKSTVGAACAHSGSRAAAASTWSRTFRRQRRAALR